MEVGWEQKGKQIMQKPIRPNAIFLHKRTDKVFDRASTLFTHLKLSDFRVTIGTIAPESDGPTYKCEAHSWSPMT